MQLYKCNWNILKNVFVIILKIIKENNKIKILNYVCIYSTYIVCVYTISILHYPSIHMNCTEKHICDYITHTIKLHFK